MSKPPVPPVPLRFAWWNVHDFAHYVPGRAAEKRWPLEPAEYEAKCQKVDAALRDLVSAGPLDILGLGEVTSEAAEGVRDRLFPGYKVVYPEAAPNASFQVAVLYRPRAGFRSRYPLLAEDVPRTTRGMAVVDYTRAGHCLRFIFCHWTAFGDNVEIFRGRLAETVSAHAYEFLNKPDRNETPHVVVMGDLNAEPFNDVFINRLHATRDRERSQERAHTSDHDVRRTYLYNPTWRLLGERHPHRATASPANCAGTYYNEKNRTWHTYDQMLITGGLLGATPPYLEESSFGITPLTGCLNAGGKPEPFDWTNGAASGLSDHLPLTGQILFPAS